MLFYFPQHEGLLPLWLLLISLVSMGNTVQAYITTRNTSQIYLNSPASITPLASRIFGTYTFVSAIIRLYAAYNIDNPQLYELAMWTFGIAWVHFFTEWLGFGTAGWGRGLAGPVIIATGSLGWMLAQRDSYVKDQA